MTVVLLAEDSVAVLVVVVLLVAVVAVDLKHTHEKTWEYKKNTSAFFCLFLGKSQAHLPPSHKSVASEFTRTNCAG
jgi:hypothetical protein